MLSQFEPGSSAVKQPIFRPLAGLCLEWMLLLHWLYPDPLWVCSPLNLAGLLLGGPELPLFLNGTALFLGSFSPAVLVVVFCLVAGPLDIVFQRATAFGDLGERFCGLPGQNTVLEISTLSSQD